MPVQKLKDFLDENGVKYTTIQHSAGYSAQEVAAYAHIPGKELAKTVMIEIDGKMAMAVVPASHRVEMENLRIAVGVDHLALATEEGFKDYFPACALGTMPPFGNLYGMAVFVSEALAEDEEIAFSAGSHSEVIRLSYSDFERLVKPKIASFSHRVP